MRPAAHQVRIHVARAERLRCGRETDGRLWRAAPIVAAGCVSLAAGARWAGWSPLLAVSALGIGMAILAAYGSTARRERKISDKTAADIDTLAGLDGELRSASWFSADETEDPWVDFHLAHAADRLQAVDWPQLYPPVRAYRAKAATALMAFVALVVALSVPGRGGVHASASEKGVSAAPGPLPPTAEVLPADMLKQLEELLRAAETGTATSSGAALTAGEVRELLARLGQSRQAGSAKDVKRDAGKAGIPPQPSPRDLDAYADRAKRAAEMASLSPEIRDALAEMARKLTEMAASQPARLKDPREAAGSAESQQEGPAGRTNSDSHRDDASIQTVKDASAGGGIGVVMMASDDAQSAREPGLGLGGGSAPNSGRGRMADLDAALRKETLEAHEDGAGEKVSTELRRKTDRGTATLAYVSTRPTAFDRGRATPPPAVPERRRAAVQSYFNRKP